MSIYRTSHGYGYGSRYRNIFSHRTTKFYVDARKIGIRPRPSTNSIEIRVYYTYFPATLATDSATMALDDDYKQAIISGAALRVVKKLLAKDPEKYALLKVSLKSDQAEEKDKLFDLKDMGVGSVQADYNDF